MEAGGWLTGWVWVARVRARCYVLQLDAAAAAAAAGLLLLPPADPGEGFSARAVGGRGSW